MRAHQGSQVHGSWSHAGPLQERSENRPASLGLFPDLLDYVERMVSIGCIGPIGPVSFKMNVGLDHALSYQSYASFSKQISRSVPDAPWQIFHCAAATALLTVVYSERGPQT